MKKILSFFLALCLLTTSASAFAEKEPKEYTSGSYKYILLKDGTAEIRDYQGGEETIKIPSKLNGKKVTSIGSYSFYNKIGIIDVIIPKGVTSIGDYAFAWSPGLRSVMIPESVKELGSNPFMSCMSLENIDISPDHPYLTITDGVLFSKPDKKIVCYPFTLYEEEYTFPQGTKIIGDAAFAESSLLSVTIPDSVRDVGDNPFFKSGASESIEIHISPDHPYLELIDGVLFSKPDKRLISYPCGSEVKEYTIPRGTALIGNYAFYYCENLKKVFIPNSVNTIGNNAFSYCNSLTSITIPESVTSIGSFAFDKYGDLTLDVERNSYAEQYCKENNLSFVYSEESSSGEEHYESGEIITFGSYEQDDNPTNGKEPIEWLVLDVQDGKALLISRYALDCQPYHTTTEDITWEKCSLRVWLNETFLNSAFTAEEQKQILTTNVTLEENPYYRTSAGNDTNEKIFLLSFAEASRYFVSDTARQCQYANGRDAGLSFNGNCWWWLRSPGCRQDCAGGVGSFGSVDYSGNYVNNGYYNGAVRPAFWIALNNQDNKYDELSAPNPAQVKDSSDEKWNKASENSPILEEYFDEPNRTLSYIGAGVGKGELYMRVPEEAEIVNAISKDTPAIQYVDRELLALAVVGTGFNEMSALFDRYNLDVVGYNALCGSYQLRSRSPVTEKELLSLMNRISAESSVVAAFLNAVSDVDVNSYPLPNDPWKGERVSADTVGGANWGVEAIHAPWFWQNYDLRGVHAGVIDNMFATNHEDLSFSAVYYNNYSSNADRWYHGTHVAGIIGAHYSNGWGISGVLKDAFLCVTDWDTCEFTGENVRYASLYGYQMKIGVMLKNGARVINFSLGYDREAYSKIGKTAEDIRLQAVSDGEYMSEILKAYLKRGLDFILVNSAGNDNIDAFDNWWPTAITDEEIKNRIVVVGAAGQQSGDYTKCSFSNYGPRVDVVAPGANIYSCIGMADGTNGYDFKSGTSMAAPFVTAACASLWEYYPALSGADIKALLVKTADIPVSGFMPEKKMINLESAFGGFAEGELSGHEYMKLHEILEAYMRNEHRNGISDISFVSGSSVYADVDFDGLEDRVSASGGSRLHLTVDFGSGEHWQADVTVYNDGEIPTVRLLSFTDGDYICYAIINENLESARGGLTWDLFGQDYTNAGSVVPLEYPYIYHLDLDSYGGIYDNRWVVVVNANPGGFSQVYGTNLTDPYYTYDHILKYYAENGLLELPIPIPYAGVSYKVYAISRDDQEGYWLVLSTQCFSPMGGETVGTLYAAYQMEDASHSAPVSVWFERFTDDYLYPLDDVTADMVSRDFLLPYDYTPPSDALQEGQYWAILYAEDDEYGSHVSPDVDLADYICFSREEIAALDVGKKLEMSRFVPLRIAICSRLGIPTDGYQDITVRSIIPSNLSGKGDVIYINRGSWDEIVLQDWEGYWRVIDDDDDYIPKQAVREVTVSFPNSIRIYDYYTPAHITRDGVPYYEWNDPYDFFVFNTKEDYFEALITMKNGVITEMTIPRDY